MRTLVGESRAIDEEADTVCCFGQRSVLLMGHVVLNLRVERERGCDLGLFGADQRDGPGFAAANHAELGARPIWRG